MNTNEIHDFRKKLEAILSSRQFRIGFLVAGFAVMVVLRQWVRSFGVSFGYLYILLISLSGFWFGVRGGIAAAAVSSIIFIVEINSFALWPARHEVARGAFLRLAVYFLEGIVMGYLCTMEKKLASEQGQKEQLEKLAHYDELTGCVNFRWTMQKLEDEIARAGRYHKEVSIAMMDVDHFKKINDMHGHLAGNECLKVFADCIKDNVRTIDILGRYGGDEFLAVFPEADAPKAVASLERIRTKLAMSKVSPLISNGTKKVKDGLVLNLSAGVASYPLNGETIEELISAADNALYHAKKGGRDRIVVERRRWLRLKPLPTLKIELINTRTGKKIEPLRIVNISQRGTLLVTSMDLSQLDLLCRVVFPGGSSSNDLSCAVRHREEIAPDQYLSGIFFSVSPQRIRESISRYCNQQ